MFHTIGEISLSGTKTNYAGTVQKSMIFVTRWFILHEQFKRLLSIIMHTTAGHEMCVVTRCTILYV